MRNLQGKGNSIIRPMNSKGVILMNTLLDPFKLFGACLLLFFKLTGYTITFGIQTICFLIQGKRDMVVEAFGWWGRSVTDAIAKIFE